MNSKPRFNVGKVAYNVPYKPELACSVQPCPRRVYAFTRCRAHYLRVRESPTGDPGPPIIERKYRRPRPVRLCTVAGCLKKYRAKGLCSRHEAIKLRHGDALAPIRQRGYS